MNSIGVFDPKEYPVLILAHDLIRANLEGEKIPIK
jgi:hypothetical protein